MMNKSLLLAMFALLLLLLVHPNHHSVQAINLFGIGCDLKCNDQIVAFLEERTEVNFSGSSSFLFVLPTWFVIKGCLCAVEPCDPPPACEAKCTPFPFLEWIGGFTCQDDNGYEAIFAKLAVVGASPITRSRRRQQQHRDRALLVVDEDDSSSSSSSSTVKQEQQQQQDDEACLAVQYDMFLIMEGAHMVGLATPVEEENAVHCPIMAFHSTVSPLDKKLTKVAMTVEVQAVTEVAEESKLHLGRRPLGHIIKAYESADVSKGNKVYDAITNNCVVMLRNMADPLDIPIDRHMIQFVTKRLLSDKARPMLEIMKQKSSTVSTVWEYGNRFLTEWTSEDLVAKVIELYV